MNEARKVRNIQRIRELRFEVLFKIKLHEAKGIDEYDEKDGNEETPGEFDLHVPRHSQPPYSSRNENGHDGHLSPPPLVSCSHTIMETLPTIDQYKCHAVKSHVHLRNPSLFCLLRETQ
jgi:hypothetical protein